METQQLPEAFGRYGEADQDFQGGGSDEFGGAAAEEEPQQQRRWTTGRKITLLLVVALVSAAAIYYTYRWVRKRVGSAAAALPAAAAAASPAASSAAAAAAAAAASPAAAPAPCVIRSWNEEEQQVVQEEVVASMEGVVLDFEQFAFVGVLSPKETSEQLTMRETLAVFCNGAENAVLLKIPRARLVRVVDGESVHRACVHLGSPEYNRIVFESEADGIMPFYKRHELFHLLNRGDSVSTVHLVSTLPDSAAGGGGGGNGGVSLVWTEPGMDGFWEFLGQPPVAINPAGLLERFMAVLPGLVRMQATLNSFQLSWNALGLVDVVYPNFEQKQWGTAQVPLEMVLGLKTRFQVYSRRFDAPQFNFWLPGDPSDKAPNSAKNFVVLPKTQGWEKRITNIPPNAWVTRSFVDFPDLQKELGQVEGMALLGEDGQRYPIADLSDPANWHRLPGGEFALRALSDRGFVVALDRGCKAINTAAELGELYRTHNPHRRCMGELSILNYAFMPHDAEDHFKNGVTRSVLQSYVWVPIT